MFKIALLTLTTAGFSVAASYALKRAVNNPVSAEMFFSIGIAACVLSTMGFIALLKTGPLGVLAPLTSVTQIFVVMVVSVVFLGESYSGPQVIAISIAVVAMGAALTLGETA